jgi:hypothetical protein
MSLFLVDALKIIIEYIAGTTVSDTDSQGAHIIHHVDSLDSELDNPIPETALPNLFFISSQDSHPDITLLNNDRGVSHNKNSVPNIVQAVIQAFAKNHIFLLV